MEVLPDEADNRSGHGPFRAFNHMLMRAENRKGYSYRVMCLLAGLCTGFRGLKRVRNAAYALTVQPFEHFRGYYVLTRRAISTPL